MQFLGSNLVPGPGALLRDSLILGGGIRAPRRHPQLAIIDLFTAAAAIALRIEWLVNEDNFERAMSLQNGPAFTNDPMCMCGVRG
jgi:hypothetical protein